jgi:hypothetical protein
MFLGACLKTLVPEIMTIHIGIAHLDEVHISECEMVFLFFFMDWCFSF